MKKPTKLNERISVLASKFPNGSLLADTDPVAFFDMLIKRASAWAELEKAARQVIRRPYSLLSEHETRVALRAALARCKGEA